MFLPCVFIAPRCYLSDGRQPSDGCEPSHDYGIQTNSRVCVPWGNCVRERRPYCRNQPVRAAGQPTLQTVYRSLPLYNQPTAPLRLKVSMDAQSTDAQSRGNGDNAMRVCRMEPHCGPSCHTADSSPPIAPPLHRMEEETSRRLPYVLVRKRTGQDWL